MCARASTNALCDRRPILLVLLILWLSGTPAWAGEASAPAEDSTGVEADASDAEASFPDWIGLRDGAAERGVEFEIGATNFGEQLLSGDGSDDIDFVGKGDLFLKLDGEKLGLWRGIGLSARGEANVGRYDLFKGVTLLPNNTAATFPGEQEADVSSLFLTQRIGDRFSAMLGKINMIDVYAAGRRFSGGRGVEGFEHIAFVAPASGIVPPYILGAIGTLRTPYADLTLLVYDPDGAVNSSGLSDPFDEGVSIGVQLGHSYRLAGLGGRVILSGYWSTQDGLDLSDTRLIPPDDDERIQDTTNGRYFFSLAFEQAVWEDAEDPARAVGLFGQAGFSEGNPNWIQWSVLTGISGVGVVPRRRGDRFGAGFFYYALSRDLQDALRPEIRLDDEYGGEVFYNAALTSWLGLGAKLQVIQSAIADADTAVIGSWRMRVAF